MEAQYKSANGRLAVRVEGKDAKELFRALAESQEIFDAAAKCGCCKSEDIRFSVRSYEGNDYYKLTCPHCRAVFDFGQTKQGGRLFPKRNDKEGNPLANDGWTQWSQKANDVPF